jgi:quercetin dioxygenase-like cupin family protein
MQAGVVSGTAREGTELNAVDATVVVKIGAEHTAGRYELFEVFATRGAATPAHRADWDKVFYVLHGRLPVQVDRDTYELDPGSCVNVPAGAANTVAALTPSAAFLAFSLGDRMGRFFTDLDRTVPTGQPLEQVVPYVLEVTERHGVSFAAEVTR